MVPVLPAFLIYRMSGSVNRIQIPGVRPVRTGSRQALASCNSKTVNAICPSFSAAPSPPNGAHTMVPENGNVWPVLWCLAGLSNCEQLFF
ncbi:hypothetical protein F9222_24815 [Escherichia coli]|nr:hypothetical protein F9222_24815 [Escherichia coli]